MKKKKPTDQERKKTLLAKRENLLTKRKRERERQKTKLTKREGERERKNLLTKGEREQNPIDKERKKTY